MRCNALQWLATLLVYYFDKELAVKLQIKNKCFLLIMSTNFLVAEYIAIIVRRTYYHQLIGYAAPMQQQFKVS